LLLIGSVDIDRIVCRDYNINLFTLNLYITGRTKDTKTNVCKNEGGKCMFPPLIGVTENEAQKHPSYLLTVLIGATTE